MNMTVETLRKQLANVEANLVRAHHDSARYQPNYNLCAQLEATMARLLRDIGD